MLLKKILDFKNTLVFRLTVLYAVLFTLLSFLAFSIFYYRIYTITLQSLDQELLHKAQNYAAIMAHLGIKGLKARMALEAESDYDETEEFIRVVRHDGQVLVTTEMSSWGALGQFNRLAARMGDKNSHFFNTLPISGREYKTHLITAAIGTGLVLQLGETLDETERFLTIFRDLFLTLLIIFMILSALIGWFIARRALLGVEEVTHTAMEIADGEYDTRVQLTHRFEEIKRLGRTFNHMLDRIQKLLRSMKEINDNIAHDLRSPLARIRGIAEMTLTTKKSIDDYKSMAVSTIEECDSLIDIVNTMLDITEAETGVRKVKPEQFDLAALISEACELFRPLANEKKIAFMAKLPDRLVFRADRKSLQRIVSNLLENAIKFTPPGGKVSVVLLETESGVAIRFEDTGPGIPAADQPRIFERFYRGDNSRAQGGVGLGLSLAKALVEAMGGVISVESTPAKGSTFVVAFSR